MCIHASSIKQCPWVAPVSLFEMGSAVSAHNLSPTQEYELYVHLHEACNEKLLSMGVLEAKVPLDQEIMKTDLVAIREEIKAAKKAKKRLEGKMPD